MSSTSSNTPKIKIKPKSLVYFALMIFGFAVLVLLQYQYWNGRYGYGQVQALRQAIKEEEIKIAKQEETNAILKADIKDLKDGLSAIEEHARLDLGLIENGETFVQLSTKPIVSYTPMTIGVDDVAVTEVVDNMEAEAPADETNQDNKSPN